MRAAEREVEGTPAATPSLRATGTDTTRFPAPAWALDAFVRAAEGGGAAVTPFKGDERVRHRTAENVERVLGVAATGDSDLIITPGTQGALFCALMALISPGEKVALPDPDYLYTERMLAYLGADVDRIPVIDVGAGMATLDLARLRAAQPRLIVLTHPNNPTGLVYTEETLDGIAAIASELDALIIADELYCRMVYAGVAFKPLSTRPGMASRTLTLLGPSKTESMTAYRLGVAVGPQEIVRRIEDLQICTSLRAPSYAQHLLSHWLVDDTDFVRTRLEEFQSLRDETVRAINHSGLMRCSDVGGTAYVFPALPADVDDHEFAVALKREVGLVVNPGYQFGGKGKNHIRLCFAQEPTAWRRSLDAMFETLRKY